MAFASVAAGSNFGRTLLDEVGHSSLLHLITTVDRYTICAQVCQDIRVTTEARVYGGKTGDQRRAERRTRLLDAGLELLGNHGLAATTVRKVCESADLPSRYFYENFSDIDAFTVAVYDRIMDELIDLGRDTLAHTPPDIATQVRANLKCAIDLAADDPRKGRVALSLALASPPLAQRRSHVAERIATMIADLGSDYLHPSTNRQQLLTATRFVVGGFAEILTNWITNPTSATRDELLNDCTGLFLAILSTVLPPSPHEPTETSKFGGVLVR